MWNPLSWVMEAAAIMAIALANGGVSAGSFRPVVWLQRKIEKILYPYGICLRTSHVELG